MNLKNDLNLEGSLWRLNQELKAVNADPEDYAIFGSTALVVRGIIDRVPGDVDVMVRRRVWGFIMGTRDLWAVETPNAGDPPILVYPSPIPLHLFYDWRDDAVDMEPEVVIAGGTFAAWGNSVVRVASVEEIKRHKEAAVKYPGREKHQPDLEAIAAYQERMLQ